jgi:histidinol phosphate phosphatase hisN-like protein
MQSKAQAPWAHDVKLREMWRPQPGRFSEEELAQALLACGAAGPDCSHDRANVLWKVERMVSGDPDGQFGLAGLTKCSVPEVLAMIGEEAGFDPEIFQDDQGPVPIDPFKVLAACREAGRRLAHAAERRERVILATGHPSGLPLLYMAVAELIEERGAVLLRPAEGLHWKEMGRRREIRYFHGVAMLSDRASTLHTHAPAAMQAMLDEARPDLVFADHGFAGAAIEAGIDTLSIADVNDPALVVAKWQGRSDTVIVMDDNVNPDTYWPCFQAVGEAFA